MSLLEIGQKVWLISPGISKRKTELIRFFQVTIREIVTVKNKDGESVRFCLSNGDSVWEGELFICKNDAIDYVIQLLLEEKECQTRY